MQTTEAGFKQQEEHSPAIAPSPPFVRPEEGPLNNIGVAHQRMQGEITRLLFALLALVIVITAVMYVTTTFTHMKDSDIRDFVNGFGPALLALLGMAIGFYFGERRR
jgi:hypothetical protein